MRFLLKHNIGDCIRHLDWFIEHYTDEKQQQEKTFIPK